MGRAETKFSRIRISFASVALLTFLFFVLKYAVWVSRNDYIFMYSEVYWGKVFLMDNSNEGDFYVW